MAGTILRNSEDVRVSQGAPNSHTMCDAAQQLV
jgi:hypothetical protein